MGSRRDFIRQSLLTAMGLGFGSVFNISMADDSFGGGNPKISSLKSSFSTPPDSARPGVYWYFMDGNMSKEGMTEDLESMKKAGIRYVIFLEVNVGIPQGNIDFFSEQWLEIFKHGLRECERLGIKMTFGIGPGWTGSGGPWVNANRSMQDLVSSTTEVSGPGIKEISLPVPSPKKPYFGEDVFTPELEKRWQNFYEDVSVLAFPTPAKNVTIKDVDDKALFYRAPYTSKPGVKPHFPTRVNYPESGDAAAITKKDIVNLTDKLQPDGTLQWDVPAGEWTIMRFGRRNNGAVTRPAPKPGLGFECDKFDGQALDDHLDAYLGRIFEAVGGFNSEAFGGLKMLHMDSWEMGAQNWTPAFRVEFSKRRGYDPLPFYPVYAGNIIESREVSERFLWDLRLTSQELILENHANRVKRYCRRHGFKLSIEPYDMNPTADLELGSVADIPMCEFWSKGFGFDSSYSCIEATSIAHIEGHSVVQAEAFTADGTEAWKQYPGSMKQQGDWAFAAGINRFFYHTFVHKSLDEDLRPGMTMGPYGVHWDRKQTWWPMVADYHRYVSRCQYMLQQGRTVADILYLTPEGAPQVFLPPESALKGDDDLPDRKGYNFDGCSPGQLQKAEVTEGEIVFPGGARYQVLVLPDSDTMTPGLLKKVRSLIAAGAVVMGCPPQKSPSLTRFPECDREVQSISHELWGGSAQPELQSEINYGKGKIFWGGELVVNSASEKCYPEYDLVAELLNDRGIKKDFESTGPLRYTHRKTQEWDMYFVSNQTDQFQKAECSFRSAQGMPELWNPLTGKTRPLPDFSVDNNRTILSLQFEPSQSYFIVFGNTEPSVTHEMNFPQKTEVARLKGSWEVRFDQKWGGPGNITFDRLQDWTSRPEEGIKYYSGTAVYQKEFDLSSFGDEKDKSFYLNLGEVKNIARIWLNGHNLGVVWTAPWRVDISQVVKKQGNKLEIEVINLWPNRLIGDEKRIDDGIKDGEWPEWLLHDNPRPSDRYTFATYQPYKEDSRLLRSGLLGPVTIQKLKFDN